MSNEIKNKGAEPGNDPKQSSTSQTVISSVQVEETVTQEHGEKDRGGVVIHNHINVSEFFQLAEKFFGTGKTPGGAVNSTEFAEQNNALKGFVGNNVSKKQGFDLRVKVDEGFEAELERRIKERMKKEMETNTLQ